MRDPEPRKRHFGMGGELVAPLLVFSAIAAALALGAHAGLDTLVVAGGLMPLVAVVVSLRAQPREPLRVVVRRGVTHEPADLLLDDMKRQLPRLQKQPEPVHDRDAASALHH